MEDFPTNFPSGAVLIGPPLVWCIVQLASYPNPERLGLPVGAFTALVKTLRAGKRPETELVQRLLMQMLVHRDFEHLASNTIFYIMSASGYLANALTLPVVLPLLAVGGIAGVAAIDAAAAHDRSRVQDAYGREFQLARRVVGALYDTTNSMTVALGASCSIHAVSGYVTVAALSEGNMPAVALVLCSVADSVWRVAQHWTAEEPSWTIAHATAYGHVGGFAAGFGIGLAVRALQQYSLLRRRRFGRSGGRRLNE
jgi:membrane associated rhomboid family serine protease